MTTGIDPLAIGFELRLSRLNRENVETKARRYLCEGRITLRRVGPSEVLALVRGNGAFYNTGYDERSGWWCECAARGNCAHLTALQLVTVHPGGTEATSSLKGGKQAE